MSFKAVLAIAVFAIGSIASANGVEKLLPSDAKNIKLKSANVGWLSVGQKLVSESNEGSVYESIYEERLEVVIAYDSKSEPAVIGYEGSNPWDDVRPFALFYFPVSKETISAIKSHRLNAADLVKFSVAKKQVQVPDDKWQYKCRYDNEYNQKIDDGCVEPPQPMKTITAPVLSVDVNG